MTKPDCLPADIHPAVKNTWTRGKRGRVPLQRVTCSHPGCSARTTWAMNDLKAKPMHVILNLASQRGWGFEDDKFVCPEHPLPGQYQRLSEKAITFLKDGQKAKSDARKAAFKAMLEGHGYDRLMDAMNFRTVLDEIETWIDHYEDDMPQTKAKNESETTTREMTRDERRAIFREIDESYERKGYVLDVTDKTIGDKLGVPWGWVAQVREENFGPAGPDPKLTKLVAEAEAIRKEAAALEEKSMSLASQAEALQRKADDLEAQVKALYEV